MPEPLHECPRSPPNPSPFQESKYDALLTDVELPGIDKDDCMPGLAIRHSVGQQTTINNDDDPT